MSAVNEITIFDCTLRDGGYYNAWDFQRDVVLSYLRSLGQAGVDVLELGFRSLSSNKYLGPFAYTTDDFLRTLPLPADAQIAVMVNARELIEYPQGGSAAVDLLFSEAQESPVSLVRVATHPSDVAQCGGLVRRLKEKGYVVALNLMQISGLTHDELEAKAKAVAAMGGIDILYIADSLGNMTPQTIQAAVAALRRNWTGRIGVHTHDNRGQALANSLAAIEAGATWVDATVLGMGRGAGNTRTEHLLLELEQRRPGTYNLEAIFHLVLEEFDKLLAQYRWGYNLLYYLSALYGIHPTYVQEMLSGSRHRTEHILDILKFLRDNQSSAYSEGQFLSALTGSTAGKEGQWNASGWCQGREVMILGSGPSLVEHLGAVCRYIDDRKPMVICLNTKEFVPQEKVNVYAACHSVRLALEIETLTSLRRPLIIPLGNVSDPLRQHLAGSEVRDYGVKLQPGHFDIQPNHCVLPSPLAFSYAVAVASAGGAQRILLAGFDGYQPSDPRQLEMVEALDCYARIPDAVELISVTPTTYPLRENSIYSPWL
jgi:4-hydroxy 2-oxovalerate aldolase